MATTPTRDDWSCSPPRPRRPTSQFAFAPNDILLFGRESAGVPDAVHDRADARLIIPLVAGRSLNLAVSAAMAVGEAVRQVG